MKRAATILAVALLLTGNALAMEIPTRITVQNLNGSQQYIKTYTVSPDTDPEILIEEPFVYEGHTYAYESIVKTEHHRDEKRQHIETITVETQKNDLSSVLAELAPTIEYTKGEYSGTLALDHTTISTKAAGYTNKSYTVSEIKEIENLSSNDMSFVPATAVKDGVTLNLVGVDWQVQDTAMVGDILVPSVYKAVATYSNKTSYRAATGYITTADYIGEISNFGVDSITYTVTYLGTEIAPDKNADDVIGTHIYLWISACFGLTAAIVLAILFYFARRQIVRLKAAALQGVEYTDYEETEEITE